MRPASKYPPPTHSSSTIGTISSRRLRRLLNRFLHQARLHPALQVRELAVVHHRNDREPEGVIADNRRMGGERWIERRRDGMDVAVVSNLAMRGDDSYTPARPDVRLEAEALQDSGRARGAAAFDLIGGIPGLFQQRRVECAPLLAGKEPVPR